MIYSSKSCRMVLKRSQSMQLVSSPCPESLSIIRARYLVENARKPSKFIEISLLGQFWALLGTSLSIPPTLNRPISELRRSYETSRGTRELEKII